MDLTILLAALAVVFLIGAIAILQSKRQKDSASSPDSGTSDFSCDGGGDGD
ncbi:hypothetical protein [Aestuariivirga sp.]|uniref:hypothetical protein n=1 Tax=Aestuariivirga sp. TaxID=2650926 RepID=UPI0035939906